MVKTNGNAVEPEGDVPRIGDYAAVGDCRTAALISRDGSLDWLCLPHFSGPAVFGALLDPRRGGRFAIRPVGPFTSTRRYVDNTNVLETTFVTGSGRATLTDCFPIVGESERMHFLQPQREILRIAEVTEGEMEFEVVFEPRPDYGRARPTLRRRGALGWSCVFGGQFLLLHSDLHFDPDATATALRARARLRAGQKARFSLSYEEHGMGIILPLGEDADRRVVSSVQWWRNWIGRCSYRGPYREAVLRSALVLKLCTFSLSGAVVAAPTTSLPERVGGVRNWDYRFCWLRDATLTLRAFFDLGYLEESEAFFEWLLHATALTQPRLQVVYDVYGKTNLHEEELLHLEGYRRSRPVRIGNDAWDQLQLDVYGAVVLAAFEYVERGGRLNRQEARLLSGFGQIICDQWRLPDQSIWEIRSGERHHTYSAFMCWVALKCLLELDERGVLRVPVARFTRERDAIQEAIETRAFNTEGGSYVDVFDGSEVDASLLLMGCYGYQGATHPRVIATYERIQRELGRNGLLFRYRPGQDGLPPGEGAFGICSFWAVDNLAKQGRVEEGERLFEHLLSYANDVGLFAEEIDVDGGEPLGNFPQAFTHIGIITAALALDNASARDGRSE